MKTTIAKLMIFLLPALILQGALIAQGDLERIRELHDELRLAPRDSFLNYAIATLSRRDGIDLKREGIKFPLVPLVTDDPARRVDLFRLATGAVALHESLQLTELLRGPRETTSRTVPISELDPPDLPSLPFEKLLEEKIAESGPPRVDAEARLVPADCLYARFASGADLYAFLIEADAWSRHALVNYGWDGRDRDLLLRQLARIGLPDPRKVPALYQALPGPIVVTMSDLFLREGTDVTMILPEKVPTAFFGREGEGATSFGPLWKVVINGRLVLSSSEKALKRIKTAATKGSLADSADYRYMRSLLPAGEEEAVFVFLSDEFLRRLVGPRLRILESRRVRCASHLRTIVNASLLHAIEEDREPAGIEALLEKGYLEKRILHCPHDGTYSLEAGFEPCCSVHGHLGRLTPHGELTLDEAREGEAAAYRRFSRSYGNFWRRYFDPVGITMKRDGASWEIDMVVLPMADNSLYRSLAAFVGGAPIKKGASLVAPSTIFQLTTKIDRTFLKDIDWRIFRSTLIPWDDLRGDFVAGFNDTMSLGLLDDELLFDFDLSSFAGQAVQWNRTRDLALVPVFGAANLPAYALFPVRDPARAKDFLEGLRRGVLLESRLPEGGRFSLKHEAYALDSGEMEAFTLSFHSFKIRLFYTLHEETLIVATRPDVLRKIVAEARPDGDLRPFNLKLCLSPGKWRKIESDMLLGYEEGARQVCMQNLMTLQPLADAGNRNAARIFGRAPECPDGGSYAAKGEGRVCCSRHGSAARPIQPAAPSEENALSQILYGLEDVTFSLRFTEQGIHTTILLKR
jgi:hypothetical protein